MARLSETLSGIKEKGSKSFLAYIVAGDPTKELTVPLMHELVAAGVDGIELGMPFSDPEAEGPVIQKAHERALANQTSLKDCLDMVREFRATDQETPVVLMGYLNPVEHMGYESFCRAASDAGIDGTILVNLPPEEAGDLTAAMADNNIEPVYLLAPTTTQRRAEIICSASRGFVYYVSLKGTTGAASLDVADVKANLGRLQGASTLPVLVGFGVKDQESARAVSGVADGVVVGSAIVSLMEKHQGNGEKMIASVGAFVREIRKAVG